MLDSFWSSNSDSKFCKGTSDVISEKKMLLFVNEFYIFNNIKIKLHHLYFNVLALNIVKKSENDIKRM